MPRRPKRRPATTPEGREGQLVSLAMDVAEKQMLEGTASSQVVTHFVKLGSSRERLEQERLKQENDLLRAKVKSYEGAETIQELYKAALTAMATYSGQEVQVFDEDDSDIHSDG